MLNDALESGDGRLIAHTLGMIARAHGMTEIARQSGIKRDALYRALSEEGNPSLDTLINVTRALGLKLIATQREVAE